MSEGGSERGREGGRERGREGGREGDIEEEEKLSSDIYNEWAIVPV